MLYLAWVISIVFAYFIGFQLQQVKVIIRALQESVKEKTVKKKLAEERPSVFLDPLDPLTQAKMEREAIMRKINPGIEDD